MTTRAKLEDDAPRMRDPVDRDIHGGRDAAYPDSPKGVEVRGVGQEGVGDNYTDGGDVADGGRHEGEAKDGVYRGIREKGLEEMSEAEYKAWMKGRTQNE